MRSANGLRAPQHTLPVCVAPQDTRGVRAQSVVLEGKVHLPSAVVRQVADGIAHMQLAITVGPVGDVPRWQVPRSFRNHLLPRG